MPLWNTAVSLEEITEDHFHSPKTAEDQLNFLKESISKSTVYRNNWTVKVFFASLKQVEKFKFLYLIQVGPEDPQIWKPAYIYALLIVM